MNAVSRSRTSIKLGVLGCFIVLIIGVTIGGRTVPAGVNKEVLAMAPQTASTPRPCPSPAVSNPPPVTISPVPPADVCFSDPVPPGVLFQFFDDFSWQSFIAAVWPAAAGQRGIPDTAKSPGDAGPLVFETFKADWEVFQPGGNPPSAFNSYAGMNPCSAQGVQPQFGDMILASFSKFQNLGQAGFGNLVGPLVAQNNTYVRYQAAFDQDGFDDILNKQWYLSSNLGPSVIFDNGSTNVKSAWIDMTGVPHANRYYTRTAWLYDPVADSCSPKTVGLVGLHIVVKTPTRPQWIWASFEQVDNVPETGAQSPYTFNDGSGTAMPNSNPIGYPPPAAPPTKYNVTRVMPISASTMTTNSNYQQAMAKLGNGVWQYYQLVMTQWPTPGSTPSNPGGTGFSIPGTNKQFPTTSGFANTTMETFFQKNVATGCMACHTLTQKNSDFNWTLKNHAYSPTSPLTALALGANTRAAMTAKKGVKAAPLNPALKALKQLMEKGIKAPIAKPPAAKPKAPAKPKGKSK